MPRFDHTGTRICSGMAGGTVSVGQSADRMQIVTTKAGGAVWFGDEVLYQHCPIVNGDEECRIEAYDGERRREIDGLGAVGLAAGLAHYALDSSKGIRGLGHPVLSLAGLKDMGADGTLGYCRSRKDGLGLILRSLNGDSCELVSGRAVSSVQVLGPTDAIWVLGSRGGTLDGTVTLPIVPDGKTYAARCVVLGGRRWFLLWHEDAVGFRLLLMPDGIDKGIVIPTPDAHRPDVTVRAGKLRCCWALTEGEGPDYIREATVDPSTALVDLKRSAPVPKIGRPLWCGWFQFGASPVPPPGNCEIRVEGVHKFITTLTGQRIAAYAEGSPDGDIAAVDRAVAGMSIYGLPVVPYWTRKAQEGRLPRGTDTVGVEAYRQAGESLSAYESRVTASVRRCGKAWLIGPAYSSNALNHPDLQSVVAVLARIALMNQNVVGVLWFSAGLGRQTGWDAHPEIHDEHRVLFAGIPSAPELEDDVINPPKVQFLGSEIIGPDKSGLVARYRNSANPEHGIIEVTLDEGIPRVEIVNAGGRDRSGKRPERRVL